MDSKSVLDMPCIIDYYIDLTPDIDSLVHLSLDRLKTDGHVQLEQTEIRRSWDLDILDGTGCCNNTISSGYG
jgi:hypothetical protein